MANKIEKKGIKRILFWFIVAVYTYLLPQVIIIYRTIVDIYSPEVAGKIPIVIIVAMGLAISIFAIYRGHKRKLMLIAAPGLLIIGTIITLESNPNKHIHIPEYVIMAWLLFEALRMDYRGKGIFILIFIAGSLIGVVDELEQGFHRSRSYGWSDMMVNSASIVVGILSIYCLRKFPAGNWEWMSYLKNYKKSSVISAFGIASTAIMCIFLFQVKNTRAFWGVYPQLLIWINAIFVVCGIAVFTYYLFSAVRQDRMRMHIPDIYSYRITASMWIILPLMICLVMHLIVFYGAFSGTEFG